MNKSLLALSLTLAASAAFCARTVTNWNTDWTYRADGMILPFQKITLPHTWNAATATQFPMVRELGRYGKKFKTEAAWKGKRVFVKFHGAGTAADILLNRRVIAHHRGGYTAFTVELTDYLSAVGKSNNLQVRVSNAETTDILPLTGDFVVYGGLHRKVELIVTDPVCISPLDYGSSGILVSQTSLTDDKAELSVRVRLSGAKQDETVTVKVNDKSFTAKGRDTVYVPVTIEKPHRWNGTADPYMYTATVSVGEDEVPVSFGLRTVTFDPNKGVILNGNPIKLRGVCKHAENEAHGAALTPEDLKEDIDRIVEIGANAVRLAHYPHQEETYELCDKAGIMVWAEIPFVGPGGYPDDGAFISEALFDNARQQVKEMIRQNGNHPSIVTWGIFNELRTNDGSAQILPELNQLVKAEDSTRPTVAASNLGDNDNLARITDVLAWNRYPGWYGGMGGFGKSLDNTHKRRPELPIAISEYGAGACVKHHEEQIRAIRPTGRFHPEAWQTQVHINCWRELAKRPFVWGSFVWNMFDFAASQRTEGEKNGINDKGLMTRDRKIRKDAFMFYKANWRNDVPVLHLCEKRFEKRQADKIYVRAFSNVGPAELWVNGTNIGTATPDDVRVLEWKDVPLKAGANKIELKALNGKATDTCTWIR